jgi:hypothetical protein
MFMMPILIQSIRQSMVQLPSGRGDSGRTLLWVAFANLG